MKIEKKDLEKSQVELTITVTPEEFDAFQDKAAKSLAKEIKVDGFRQGNAPRDIVEQKVGADKVFEEAVRLAVPETLLKALDQEKIEAIGQPEVTPQKVALGNEFVYKAKIATMPKIEVPDYSDVKVARKSVKVDSKEVEKTLEDLRKSRATSEAVNRAAKEGDRVEVDFEAKLNKVTIEGGESKNHPVVIGENRFIPGFEEKLVGMKAGEEKDFSLIFPKDYHKKDLANREVDFHVKVKTVQELKIPELNDEFAKSLGEYKDLADLKEKLEHNIQHEGEHKEENRVEMEIVHKIGEKIKFDLPEVLIKAEQEKIVSEMEQDLMSQGVPFDKYLESINKKKEDLVADQKETALKRVKASLVLRAVAKKEGIKVDDKEVVAEIEKIKKAYGDMYAKQPEMAKHFESKEYRDYLRSMMLNRKVFKYLKQKCATGEEPKHDNCDHE